MINSLVNKKTLRDRNLAVIVLLETIQVLWSLFGASITSFVGDSIVQEQCDVM